MGFHILRNMLSGLKAMAPSQNGVCCLNLCYRRRRSDSQREINSTNSFPEETFDCERDAVAIYCGRFSRSGRLGGMTGPFLLQSQSILGQKTDQITMRTWHDWVGKNSFPQGRLGKDVLRTQVPDQESTTWAKPQCLALPIVAVV